MDSKSWAGEVAPPGRIQPLPTIAIEGRVVADAALAIVAVTRELTGVWGLAGCPLNEAALFVAFEWLFC